MKSLNKRCVLITIFAICLMSPLVVSAAERPSDETISFWVAEAFLEDPRIITTAVDIRTTDGIVTLTGSVRSLAGKKYAGMEARKINGVRGVINNLVVKPVYRPDVDIAQDIRHRIINSAVIKSYGIGVTVVDGVATLRGKVDSWTERQEAELQASEVRGVKEVRNELTTEYRSRRSDEEIRNDVHNTIRRDVYLSGLPISISVKNGVVTLQGEVGNAYQKERASRAARGVNNVKEVENNLTVQWWKERGVRKQFPTPSDKELRDAVRDVLYQDIRIEPSEVTVEASYGHVTLRGSVPTHYQKKIAEQDAREVVGVGWVSNLLSVDSERRDDLAIWSDVRFEIESDYALNGQDIKVAVKGGIVTLSGNVNTFYGKTHAADVISRIRGVRDVVNNITVNWSPKYTDAALRNRIKSRIASNWATRWVADQITVEVNNSKATLTGEVNTWGQRKEAGRVAFLTDGIRAVNNRLTVAGAEYPWEEWYPVDPDDMYDPYYRYKYYFFEAPY